MSVKSDMERSASAFLSIVWPVISVHNYKLIQMENVIDSNFAKDLDMRAGIDAWIKAPRGILGVATRIQIIEKGKDPWDSYTIRHERDTGASTEYVKRWTAIKDDFLYPQATVQAYLSSWKGPILSVGISLTRDIYKCIEEGQYDKRRNVNANFIVVYWSVMREKNRIVAKHINEIFPNISYSLPPIVIIPEPPIDMGSIFI